MIAASILRRARMPSSPSTLSVLSLINEACARRAGRVKFGRFPVVSAWIFYHAALREVFDGAADLNPIMFRLLKNRSEGSRVFWICQRANGNANQRRQALGLPVDRRPAVWTKVAVNLAAACSIAGELFRSAGDGDCVDRIKGADAKWSAGSPLAVETMTGDDQF